MCLQRIADLVFHLLQEQIPGAQLEVILPALRVGAIAVQVEVVVAQDEVIVLHPQVQDQGLQDLLELHVHPVHLALVEEEDKQKSLFIVTDCLLVYSE